jgi:hypothetical protein
MRGEESGGEKVLKEQYGIEMLAPSDMGRSGNHNHPFACGFGYMGSAHPPNKISFYKYTSK